MLTLCEKQPIAIKDPKGLMAHKNRSVRPFALNIDASLQMGINLFKIVSVIDICEILREYSRISMGLQLL